MSPRAPELLAPGAAHVAVLEAVDRYFHALHRGDVAGLAEAFHPLGSYATASAGELRHLSVPDYLEVVRGRASPLSLGDAASYAITSVQVAGDCAAVVTLRSAMMGRHFEDFLNFVRVDGSWRIIAKVFHFTDLQPAGS